MTKYGRKWACWYHLQPRPLSIWVSFRPTNEQVAECTQIPWNEAVRDDIYVQRGSLSIPPVSWTHRQFWFSKVLRKWQTSAFQNYKYQSPISTPCIFMYTFKPTLKRITNTHQLQRLLSLFYILSKHISILESSSRFYSLYLKAPPRREHSFIAWRILLLSLIKIKRWFFSHK